MAIEILKEGTIAPIILGLTALGIIIAKFYIRKNANRNMMFVLIGGFVLLQLTDLFINKNGLSSIALTDILILIAMITLAFHFARKKDNLIHR